MADDIPFIPVRRLHNYVYCPRLMYFQFVENIFVYNADVADGEGIHKHVDVPSPGEYPEEFRPLIVDSVVISLVNKGAVSLDDFIFSSQGCALKRGAHQAFWNAYARRMAEELTHPVFHYRMSYRRLLEVQVRQLWRIFRGDQASYHPIITR